MPVPSDPKIYHIVHVDRLASIIQDGYIWCDAEVLRRCPGGTTIGMNQIKERRLKELLLRSHPGLHVGECVPFYFCPRSIMLYLIYQGNHPELSYRGGQGSIVHLEADLKQTVAWANESGLRWAFTTSNAGAYYFRDRCDLSQLKEIEWDAVEARDWQHCKEGKQAEVLIEHRFPWKLVSRIGVQSDRAYREVVRLMGATEYKPRLDIRTDWYY